MNPYGPEFQTEFCYFLGEDDLNSENGGIYESPPDRHVPNSSPARSILKSNKAAGNNSGSNGIVTTITRLPVIIMTRMVTGKRTQGIF